jgi:hypothetical protein
LQASGAFAGFMVGSVAVDALSQVVWKAPETSGTCEPKPVANDSGDHPNDDSANSTYVVFTGCVEASVYFRQITLLGTLGGALGMISGMVLISNAQGYQGNVFVASLGMLGGYLIRTQVTLSRTHENLAMVTDLTKLTSSQSTERDLIHQKMKNGFKTTMAIGSAITVLTVSLTLLGYYLF